MTTGPIPDALVPLLGRTFTLYAGCWSTGYPGIFKYRGSLTLTAAAGGVIADILATFEVERSGEESERVETPATYTGVGRDGTLRLTLKAEMPWGPKTIKIDPGAGTFATAGAMSSIHQMRAVAVPVGDYAAFDATALECLRAICQSWEPGFVEGAGGRAITTDFRRSEEKRLDGTVKQSVVREFVVCGMRPPADLMLTLVQRRVDDGPWCASAFLGRGHDEDFVAEAVQIFDRYFPRPPRSA